MDRPVTSITVCKTNAFKLFPAAQSVKNGTFLLSFLTDSLEEVPCRCYKSIYSQNSRKEKRIETLTGKNFSR